MGPVFEDWSGNGASAYMKARHSDVLAFMGDASHAPQDVEWVEGSALAVRRDCAASVGPLEPDLFMYWEEVDFCRRARFQGWRVVIVPGAVIRHFGGGTAAQAFSANRLAKLKERNQYVYSLCDPNRYLVLNGLRTLHLLLVNLKAALLAPSSLKRVCHHLAVFLWFISGVPTWCKKWARDRRREGPPKVVASLDAKMASFIAGRHANPLSWP